MKRGQILEKEVGYTLLTLIILSAVLLAVSRGCNIIQSDNEKSQALGTLTQLSNFLDSLKDNQQSEFFIYSPQGYYLQSFTSFSQCTTNCICICKDIGCLSDQSFCKDISKPLNVQLSSTPIGLGTLLVTNNANSYDILVAQYDTSNDQVVNVTPNCSGQLVTLTGNFQIRQSVKPAFDEAQKYAESLGRKLIVTSAYRDAAYQQRVLTEKGSDTACTPRDTPSGFGMNCPHVLGCAIDVHFNTTLLLPKGTQNSDTLLIRQIMQHAGFVGYPLDSKDFEFWHFNYGITTAAAPVPVTTLMGSKYQYSK